MIGQLKPGMTQEQVKYIMGTPVLQSSFDANRWDYIYTFQPGHGQRTTQQVTLFFSNGILKKIVTK